VEIRLVETQRVSDEIARRTSPFLKSGSSLIGKSPDTLTAVKVPPIVDNGHQTRSASEPNTTAPSGL